MLILHLRSKYNETHCTDFNGKNVDNVRFVTVNIPHAVSQHLTPKEFVDDATDEISIVRIIQDNNFKKFNLTNTKNKTLDTQAVNFNQVFTKPYVDQFHQGNERCRKDGGLDFYNERSDLVKKKPGK